MKAAHKRLSCVFGLAMSSAGLADAWSTRVSLETRWFPDPPLFADQTAYRAAGSVAVEPQWRWRSANGSQRFNLKAFARWDQRDPERTHIDLREALWERDVGRWVVAAGVGRVFWGVTESRHLVDVINQTDAVEDIDEEDRLGQPMVSIERMTDAGSWTVWALPGFRERTMPDSSARLRGPVPIAARSSFESGAGRRRMDAATRWTQVRGGWDIGVSAFYGTSREPRWVSQDNAWLPRYDVMGQLSLDVQWTTDPWLWKAEALRRSGPGYRFTAAVVGLEAARFNIFQSGTDLSLIAEYLRDDRPHNAPPTAFDDDVFVGVRWAKNDPDATSLLVGLYYDRNASGRIGFLEAERRLGAQWKLEMETRWLQSIATGNPVYDALMHDSFVTLRLSRFY